MVFMLLTRALEENLHRRLHRVGLCSLDQRHHRDCLFCHHTAFRMWLLALLFAAGVCASASYDCHPTFSSLEAVH